MAGSEEIKRTIGLLGATGIGVGAIVGGGILALAGVAFAQTGTGAMAAFTLNGLIAFFTVLSFSEMACAFPQSGGSYTFAKKVFSVQAAFGVGWVVWLASVAVAVLYSIGFAAYTVLALEKLWQMIVSRPPPAWVSSIFMVRLLAIGVTLMYTISLIRKIAGGGQLATVGKMVVFLVLILGGLWVLMGQSPDMMKEHLKPLFPMGALGLFQAMGYTFIALQGFDIIAALAGEVKDPKRTLPRSMMLSLGIALLIYLPLLFILSTLGVKSGQSLVAVSSANPETFVALAAQNFLGPLGFWLVVLAALFSMLSALYVNLLASSRVAAAMARDRVLPKVLGNIHPFRGTPITAILISSGMVCIILLVIPDVATAGAISSLIFLISFALAHLTCLLARYRVGPDYTSFKVPFFPFVPVAGGLACMGLAIFQGIAVPTAGLIICAWLFLGGLLYLFWFARQAQVFDALSLTQDPLLVQLRGRNPLVLVPLRNPANAESMVAVANALAPPKVGRVLLLAVVQPPEKWVPGDLSPLRDVQAVLREALTASFSVNLFPEALTTVAPHPWPEIIRVSQTYQCSSMLLGLSDLNSPATGKQLEELMNSVNCDVVILRSPPGWQLSAVRRVLVPLGGWGDHDVLRARLLGSFCRGREREIKFLRVVPENTSEEAFEGIRRELAVFALEEILGVCQIEVVRNNNVEEEIIRQAASADLIILGLQRKSRRSKAFGSLALKVAAETRCGIIMINRGG